MSSAYRYRKAGHLKIGDEIMLEDGGSLKIDMIEADDSNPSQRVFIDEKGDVAIKLNVEDVVRLSSES